MIVPKAASQSQLAMISVPWQEYTTPYAPAEALLYGTVFSGLNQPYVPTQPMTAMQKKRS